MKFLLYFLLVIFLYSCEKEEYSKWTCSQSMLTTWPNGDTISYNPNIPYDFTFPMTSEQVESFLKAHSYKAPREGGLYYVESKARCGKVVCPSKSSIPNDGAK
jgi:hypothetical protein